MHLLPLILLAGAASAISDCARANIAWPTVFTDVDGLSTNACCTNNRGVDCGFSDKEEGVGRSCRIQCDENGFITSIHLQNIQLSTSTVPDFSTLTKLTYLDISMNAALIGSIPQSLPPALKTLHMYGCKITGPIPPFPGSLTDINLSSNQLSGSIPALPANLNTLNLNNNQLGGSIPALPPSLKVLSLRDNRFEGSLPSLPNSLTSLELQNNHLSGFIPTPFNFRPQAFDENCFVNAINLGSTNKKGCRNAIMTVPINRATTTNIRRDVILPISVDDPVLVTTTTQHRNVILPITVDDPVPVTTTTDNINVILPISLDPGPVTVGVYGLTIGPIP